MIGFEKCDFSPQKPSENVIFDPKKVSENVIYNRMEPLN